MKGKVDNKNWMIIRATDLHLVKALVSKAKELGLSVSNDGETKTGIEHIQLGNSVSVGTSEKFNINWARSIDYYANRGIVPVYDIKYDWAKIMDRLEAYAKNCGVCGKLEGGDTFKIADGVVTIGEAVDLNAGDIAKFKELIGNGFDVTIDQFCETITIADDDGETELTFTDLDKLSKALAKR